MHVDVSVIKLLTVISTNDIQQSFTSITNSQHRQSDFTPAVSSGLTYILRDEFNQFGDICNLRHLEESRQLQTPKPSTAYSCTPRATRVFGRNEWN